MKPRRAGSAEAQRSARPQRGAVVTGTGAVSAAPPRRDRLRRRDWDRLRDSILCVCPTPTHTQSLLPSHRGLTGLGPEGAAAGCGKGGPRARRWGGAAGMCR